MPPHSDGSFYQELLMRLLSQHPMQISFPTLQQNPAQLVELRCFQALRQIKEITVSYTHLTLPTIGLV